MVNIKQDLALRANYGGARQKSDIKYIVVHYTANDGDSDEGNATFFKNGYRGASAHYFVDDDSITRSVPDLHKAWSVGGGKWDDCAKTGGGKFFGKASNANTLNIEMCDALKDGNVMVTAQTRANTIDLVVAKMREYNINLDHVIRHFDVNGKHCPAYYMDETAWGNFKLDVARVYGGAAAEHTNTVITSKPVHGTTAAASGKTAYPVEKVRTWQHAWNVGFDYRTDSGRILKEQSLDEDGSFGPACRAFASRHYLYRGIKGCPTAVKWLQAQLGIDQDGSFGPATEKALNAKQVALGLVADGKCGPATIAALLGV